MQNLSQSVRRVSVAKVPTYFKAIIYNNILHPPSSNVFQKMNILINSGNTETQVTQYETDLIITSHIASARRYHDIRSKYFIMILNTHFRTKVA